MNTQKKLVLPVSADRELLRYCVPQSVFRQSPFVQHFADKEAFNNSAMVDFHWRNGNMPIVCVSGHDELKIEYAAASMVSEALAFNSLHIVWWFRVQDQKLTRYTGQYKDPTPWPKPTTGEDPTIIVCTGLGANPTDVQIESVHDLTARWSGRAQFIICGHTMEPVDYMRHINIPVFGAKWVHNTTEVKSV